VQESRRAMPKGQELTAFSQTIAFAVALCSSRPRIGMTQGKTNMVRVFGFGSFRPASSVTVKVTTNIPGVE
jgi:hypothetical protein